MAATQQQTIWFLIKGDSSNAVHSFKRLSNEMSKTASKASKLFKNITKNAVKPIESAFGKLSKSFSGGGSLGKLFNSIKRVAFYRLIRSAIRAITEAFSEGLKNAYAFSKGLQDAADGRIAVALDSITSNALKMKNQLGAAFGSLITAITPFINTLITLITNLATAITQLFAALTGRTFLKAKDVSAQFADDMNKGAKSAKEWKNQLLGFDVINRLEEPSNGGGGSKKNEIDPSQMFEVATINSAISEFVNKLKSAIRLGDWAGVGKLLGGKVNEIVERVNWANVGLKIGRFINGAFQTAFYTLKEIDFVNIGTRLAEFINGILGEIDFTFVGSLLVEKFIAGLELFGSFLGRLDWGQVGYSIGNFLRGALSTATDWLNETDWINVANTIKTNLSDFIAALDPDSLKTAFSTFFNAALEAYFAIAETLFPDGIATTLARALVNIVKKAVAYIKTDDFKEAANILQYKMDKAMFGEKVANWWWSQGDYVGKETVMGLINGIESKESDLTSAVKDNLTTPLIETTRSELAVNSPSRVFYGIGENVINGFLGGMKAVWGTVTSWISTAFGGLISWCQRAHNWIQNVIDGISLVSGGGYSQFSGWAADVHSITGRASGGYVPSGELFVAREQGPELVGSIGGRTAVANNDQIVEAIKAGVYEAVVSGMSGIGGNNQPIIITMDGKEIARTTTKYQNQMARAGAY